MNTNRPALASKLVRLGRKLESDTITVEECEDELAEIIGSEADVDSNTDSENPVFSSLDGENQTETLRHIDSKFLGEEDDQLSTVDELVKAVDIGRKIMTREKSGGRPSKVESSLGELETVIELYSGEQRERFIRRELRGVKSDVSPPTWRKFREKASSLLESETGESVEWYLP